MVNQKVPLYLQIKERIRNEFGSPVKIEGDETGGSNRLPTLEELQEIIQVSRPTISKALAALAAEGFLVKEKGRGTFALAVKPGTGQEEKTRRQLVPTIGFIAPLYGADTALLWRDRETVSNARGRLLKK